ncbi:hypothetical protein P7K49_033981, partial [Saguinus oedipus]
QSPTGTGTDCRAASPAPRRGASPGSPRPAVLPFFLRRADATRPATPRACAVGGRSSL